MSKKQQSTAISSCEAEYMAASFAACEAVWLSRLFKEDLLYDDVHIVTASAKLSEKEFKGMRPLVVFEDNTGAIALSKNPVTHKRSKHIEIRYHFVREKVRSGEIVLRKIDTRHNIADLWTKAVKPSQYIYLRNKVLWPHEEPVNTK